MRIASATLTLAAVLAFFGLSLAKTSALFDSKVQQKEYVLNKNAKATKTPDKNTVPFNHETHSQEKYSADLKSVLRCAECHHTDQPKDKLTGVLKTSERDMDLTTALLAQPGSKDVKSCRACHAHKSEKPINQPCCSANPVVEYEEKGEVTLDNYEAYHTNCIDCHLAVKKIKKDTTAVTSCAGCHSGT